MLRLALDILLYGNQCQKSLLLVQSWNSVVVTVPELHDMLLGELTNSSLQRVQRGISDIINRYNNKERWIITV